MLDLTNNFNADTLNNTVATATANSEIIIKLASEVLTTYTADLGKVMTNVYNDVIAVEAPADKVLENYMLSLSNILYFVGSKLETVGIKDDVAEMTKKEAYNNTYLEKIAESASASKKPTVAELSAISEESSKYEQLVNAIYTHVYKTLRFKVDAGYDMLNSIRKLVTKRIADAQLASVGTDNSVSRILNEG